MLNGIDVSGNNGTTFSTKNVSFGFVKATEGHTYVNPKQAEQTKRLRDAGSVLGFYHFLWPGNIQQQAEYFVEKCLSQEGDILACDWEETTAGTYASCAEKDQFIAAVKALRPSHKVVLYCNRDFWLNIDTTSNAGDGLWIADPSAPVGQPRIKASWLFHQYGEVNGIDVNVGNFSTLASLETWATGVGHNPTPPPAPPAPAQSKYEPFPGHGFFVAGRKSPIVKAMHDRLVAVGCNHYQSSKNKDVIGSGDIASYEAWQHKYNRDHHKGWTGSALKWPPGKETWDALKVPNVPNK